MRVFSSCYAHYGARVIVVVLGDDVGRLPTCDVASFQT